jgi:hypothetical protein
MFAFSIVWVVLATAVVVLATVRKFASVDEENYTPIRASEPQPLHPQGATVRQSSAMDQWGQIVTGVAALYCLTLLSGFLYIGWQNTQQILK